MILTICGFVRLRIGVLILFKLSCFDMEYEELAGNFAKKFMNYEKN